MDRTTEAPVKPIQVLGKDGRPFDRDRYVSWGLKGMSSMELKPWGNANKAKRFKKGVANGKWRCPTCSKRFIGVAIKKHRESGCK